MSLFQFSSGEYTPLFHLLDDYDVHRSGRGGQTSNIRAFRPKFDVRELKDAYELQGELPGIEQKDVNIEFVDPHTLVVSGRVEHSASRGNASVTQDGPSGRSSRKATVEDEGSGDSTAKPSSPATRSKNTPRESAGEPEYTYWVSERSVGEFHRSFSFPSRVDQDAVKARLKNGILNVTIPKSTAPISKKIHIDE